MEQWCKECFKPKRKSDFKKRHNVCKECWRLHEAYRAMEQLFDKNPHLYRYCSNPDCNYILHKRYEECHRCGALPEEVALN